MFKRVINLCVYTIQTQTTLIINFTQPFFFTPKTIHLNLVKGDLGWLRA